MCGIAGFYSKSQTYNMQDLIGMTDALTHRGPDASGYFLESSVGLGHRRLSILDLSEASNQPFFSRDQKYCIIYNGEVYNFRELKNQLDVSLRTTGDTEVILELYIKFGPSFLQKLNGMFSFVIYDKERRELFVARDRLGVKPLYYYWQENNFLFASEIKSLLKVNSDSKISELDFSFVPGFLKLGFLPEPDTAYRNIKKFPAGCYAIVQNGTIEFKKYWSWEDKIRSEPLSDETIAKEELKSILESSIKFRMISDVPFGTFLSGGIDSSLVTSIAQANSLNKIKTFSIGFEDSRFDESNYAKSIANYLNTDHFELFVTEKEAKECLLTVIDHFDEPFSDSSSLPTYMVSKLASNKVKMALTGDGGDELFMGYGAYNWAQRLSSKHIQYLSSMLSFILSNGNSRLKRIGKMFASYDKGRFKSHVFSQEQYFFTDSEVRRVLCNYKEPNYSEEFSCIQRKLTAAESQALFDLNYYLKDDLLPKIDRTSMLTSLELREPLLDYRLVEFSLNLSSDLKIKNGYNKYLLKQVLYDYVPSKYFERPKKGFSIPLAKWLKNDLKDLIEDNLSRNNISKVGQFQFEEINKLRNKFYKGDDYLFQRIWLVILIQRWFLNKL